MALVRCKVCGVERAVGFMPPATCGLALIPASVGVLLSAVVGWPTLGFWAMLNVPVCVVVLAVLHFVPWTIEYLLVARRGCPSCGEHGCHFPHTRGFGA